MNDPGNAAADRRYPHHPKRRHRHSASCPGNTSWRMAGVAGPLSRSPVSRDGGGIPGDHAQQGLHLVDARPAVGAINHDTKGAGRLLDRQQSLQPGIGVGQMVQHTDAIDVVKLTQTQARKGEQGVMHPTDIFQLPYLRPAPGDVDAGLAQIQVNYFRVGSAQLFRQVDRAVTRAAPGYQDTKAARERLCAAEAIMIDHRQVVEPRGHQSPVVILGIARGIGQAFILLAYFREVIGVE
jgi:hypothetical protein